MGNAAGTRLKPPPQDKPEEINEADLVLCRKLQIILDSCVGVLHRNDFLDFNCELDDADLRDLSRFLYLSFPTLPKAANQKYKLKPYLFRSAILSIFGHIIVNSMTYIKRNSLDNPFLHVVTGTPGLGKSAIPTYFYHYNVKTYKKEGTKPTNESTPNVQPNPEANSQPETKSKSEDDYIPANIQDGISSYLGQIIVPSVECFPHFLRLIIGKEDHRFVKKQPTPIQHDVTVNAQSLLKKGSVIAEGSILYSAVPPETLGGPLKLQETRSVAKHSVINPGSVLYSRPYNAVMTLPPDQLPGLQTIHVTTYSYVVNDNIVLYPNSEIAAGSFLLHHGPNHKEVFPETKPLGKDYTIEAGSTIKAGSSIERKSNLVYGYSVQNKFRGTEWHVIDDLTISRDTNIPAGNHCVLFTSPEGSRWNKTDTPGGKGRQYFIAEYVVPKYSLQEEAALLNTMGQDEELSKARQKSIEEGLRKRSGWENVGGTQKRDTRRQIRNPPRRFLWAGCLSQTRSLLVPAPQIQTTAKKRGAIFHNFVLDAIAGGLYIENPTRIHSKTPPPCLPFWLPESLGESNIYLRSSTNVLRACLPDISRIKTAKLSPYEAKYDVLFKNSLGARWAPFIEFDEHGNLKSIQRASSSHQPLEYKCFTYSLMPLGSNNAGFDSILLFFKVHLEEPIEHREHIQKKKIVIDALSVIFIQSTLAQSHDICPSGANLMLMWLAIFFSIYELQPSAIFPYFFFMKSPNVQTFGLKGTNHALFFMNELNFWVVNVYARTAQDKEIKYTDRLILDSVVSLLPNTNPLHFRCCFCGVVLKEDFPNHCCPRLEEEELPIQSSEKLIASPWVSNSSGMGKVGIYDRHNPQENWARDPNATFTSTVMFTLAREAVQNDDFHHTQPTNCGKHWISVAYPTIGRIPNSHDKGYKIDWIDIVLIEPTPERNDFYPLANDPPEPKPSKDKDFFQVEYDAPILDLFSYFPPRSVVVEENHSSDVDQQDPGDDEDLTNQVENSGGSEDPTVEVMTANSHLLESLSVVRRWGDKTAIGFERTNGKFNVRSVGVSYPPHKSVEELYENTFVPLARMFVPMNCLNRLPVTLYGAQKLIPFEIKCLLVGSSTLVKEFSTQFSVQDHLRRGQVVAFGDLQKIFGQDTMKEPLLTKDLGPVHSHRSSMMELCMSDFQLLGSYVNGSRLVVADILERCSAYLRRPDQLTLHDMNYLVGYFNDPEEYKKIKERLESKDQKIVSTTKNDLDGLYNRASRTCLYSKRQSTSLIGSLDGKPTLDSTDLDEITTISKNLTSNPQLTYEQADVVKTLDRTKQQIDINLEVMKTLLSNALLIVKQQFQLLVNPYTESNPVTNLSNEDSDLLFNLFLANPLLDHSRLGELLQFLTDASQIQNRDPKTVIQLANDQFDTAKQDLDLVFMILRGEGQNVDATKRKALSDKMVEIRSHIIHTQIALFRISQLFSVLRMANEHVI
ncbi:hypothetical protein BLNAU_13631 [Blattamonas nauphoetae]|uniref:Uncharacterized protein n=1 Tax=Blattamonas nauphoetae TaxID=2049346 RepID=A0ABQ9XKW5_9EUKA|nr:hypothetical protein BLNAU_13631 [Blattamonas nauphoetae]